MVITDRIDVEKEILASAGYSDVRCGTYLGERVAVKTLKVTMQDDVLKFRKVSIGAVLARLTNRTILPAILQRSYPLGHIEPSERVETPWCLRGHGKSTIHHRV
jgi:hypothetical protein